MTCGDEELVGTRIEVFPSPACALTRSAVRPGGSTSVTSPNWSLTRTVSGTAAKVRVILPELPTAVTCVLVRPVTVMLPDPLEKSAAAPAGNATSRPKEHTPVKKWH